jgi:D-alanyl-D-alanine carboxypeptidase
MLKMLGANYEFEGAIYKEQTYLVLDGNLCTNMGDGCKNKARLKLKLKKS